MQDSVPIDSLTWLRHSWRNRIQSLILLATMACFLAFLGWLLWGKDGIFMLVMAGSFGVLINPSISPRLVMRLYGAIPMSPNQAPDIFQALTRLSQRAGLLNVPIPYYVPSSMLNAFAVGTQGHAAIGVTDGLLRQLEFRELIGVLAHEVSHIRNNDLWVLGLADMFSRMTSLLSLLGQFLLLLNLPIMLFTTGAINWFAIFLLIFAPSLSALAQLGLSRTREYDADLNAAFLTGDPDGLARALAKIERVQGGWLERIFMPGRRIPEPSLLRTHPPTHDRIARLMELKPKLAGFDQGLPLGHAPNIHMAFGTPIVRQPSWHLSGLWH